MKSARLDIVFVGLSISSSWGNGHATTYRSLVRALARAGHRVTFLERDMPWYRAHRDPEAICGCTLYFYTSLADLDARFAKLVRTADAVIVGSYVPEGVAVGAWVLQTASGVTAFYDIDTPVTLAKLERGDEEYVSRDLVAAYDLYLSFTGGPTLKRLTQVYGARRPRPLYCSVDPDVYAKIDMKMQWQLGYLGTYCSDRQPALERLLMSVADRMPDERFVVGGPCYPDNIAWPPNVTRVDHVSPREHVHFYGRQRFTLNLTRADMVSAGWSPSVRLFEAAACGVPIISDQWPGLESFFTPGSELLVANSTGDVLDYLHHVSEHDRRIIADNARARVLAEHTPQHRAAELLAAIEDAACAMSAPRAAVGSS